LSHWNDGRGFGFIQPEGSAPEDALFVHVRAFPDRRALPVGMDLTFERGTDPRGRPCALAVRPRESLRRLGLQPE
jgi:cold shock CspA family protein